MQGLQHTGTIDSTSLFSPFGVPSLLPGASVPLGLTWDRKPFGIEPWRWMDQGYTDGNVCRIMGNRNCGKTTLAKTIGLRLAGYSTESGAPIRLSADDTRLNKGIPEYQSWTHFLGCEQANLATAQINFLDQEMGMGFSEQYTAVLAICEHVQGSPLTGLQPLTVQIALKKLIDRWPNQATPELFALVLRTLRLADVDAFYAQSDANSVATGIPASAFAELLGEPGSSRHHAITEAEFLAAVAQTSAVLTRLLSGDFGQTFGGGKSLSGFLSQRAVSPNYTGIDDKSLALVQTLMWMWRTSAITRGDSRFLTNLAIHDENYGMWQHLPYARAMYNNLKKSRATGELIVMVSHRMADSHAVGSEGSEQRQLAVNALNETDIWFLGRMPPSAAADLRSQLKFSKVVEQDLHRMPRGSFYCVVGDQEPVPFHLMLNNLEIPIISSNMAAPRWRWV